MHLACLSTAMTIAGSEKEHKESVIWCRQMYSGTETTSKKAENNGRNASQTFVVIQNPKAKPIANFLIAAISIDYVRRCLYLAACKTQCHLLS